MKITEAIRDRRVSMYGFVSGTMVRRERRGVVTGPYIIAAENADTPLAQDGYINGMVRHFLVHLGTGYRATIEDDDKLFEVDAEIMLRDPKMEGVK